MFEKAVDVAMSINHKIHYFDELFTHHYNVEHLYHVSLPSQDEVYIVGMVMSEADKFNINSLLLQGSLETSCGLRIVLDFSTFTNPYSLFPGQVVMLLGTNTTGKAFSVSQIFLPPLPPFLGVQRPLGGITDQRELSLAAACGPYTSDDDLMTLSLLLKRVSDMQPDVIFLMGPFVDIKKHSLNYSFDDQFGRVLSLLDDFLEAPVNGRLQVVLVPSERDGFHVPVYPQPPFDRFKHKRIHLVSNPNVIKIGGELLISSCSTDSLFFLSAGEISNCTSGDRIGRLLNHVLSQRSFQPVYPPPCSDNIVFPSERRIPPLFTHRPHVMFVESDLKHFIKHVEGCLCVNPGRVFRGERVGCFAYVSLREDDSAESGMAVSCAQIMTIS